MKHFFTKQLTGFLMIRRAQHYFSPNDLQSLQRLNLFRTFSLTAFLIGMSLNYQVLSIFKHFDLISVSIALLTIGIATNYFLLNYHRKFRIAYSMVILGSLLVLHFVTYYSGGIRNSGWMFLGGLILATFMMLGNREGKIVSFLSVVNLVYFYFYSNIYGQDVRNIVDSDPEGLMLNMDYLISYVTGTLLIYSLSNNLESSKNIVIANVIESKKILEKKNEELKKLSLVASNTDNSVVITNPEGVVEWVNEGFTRLTGYTFDEIVGHKQSDMLFGPLTSEETIRQMEERMANLQSFSGEVQKYRADGQTIRQQVTITPILDQEGKVDRFIHVESDINERKEAEQKMEEYYRYLEKANKELDKFAYVVSHDLKAPLRAISNLTTWIEEDMGDNFTNDTRSHFKMLKGRVMRMEALINGILDYSRADRVKSPNTRVDVRELLDEIIEMLVQDEKVNVKIHNALPVLFTEKMKLQQVFSNLISNAIKHNDKPETSIDVFCIEQGDNYLFTVRDNGPGIDPQFHEKIFVIFQTLQARDTFESTGVGLAIVKKIIDEVGGKIWVESDLGENTRFVFMWPKQSSSAFKPFQFTLQPQTHPGAIARGNEPISSVA